MVKLIVMYGPPDDPDAFDTHYFASHVPLAAKIPGLRRFEVTRLESVDGAAIPYHLMAELSFDDAEAMGAALESDEGKAAAADVANFATGGATMLTGAVLEEV